MYVQVEQVSLNVLKQRIFCFYSVGFKPGKDFLFGFIQVRKGSKAYDW